MAYDLKLALFKPLIKLAMERSGHGAALGFDLRVVERGEVSMTFPYNEAVIGNPRNNIRLSVRLSSKASWAIS